MTELEQALDVLEAERVGTSHQPDRFHPLSRARSREVRLHATRRRSIDKVFTERSEMGLVNNEVRRRSRAGRRASLSSSIQQNDITPSAPNSRVWKTGPFVYEENIRGVSPGRGPLRDQRAPNIGTRVLKNTGRKVRDLNG
jgi:hypothetical protein